MSWIRSGSYAIWPADAFLDVQHIKVSNYAFDVPCGSKKRLVILYNVILLETFQARKAKTVLNQVIQWFQNFPERAAMGSCLTLGAWGWSLVRDSLS